MKTAAIVLLGCMGAWSAVARELTPQDDFYRESFMVFYKKAGLKAPGEYGGERRFNSRQTVALTVGLKNEDFLIKEVKDCCMVDATGRNLNGKAEYADSFFELVSEEICPRGGWVDAQGVLVVEKRGAEKEAVVLFPDRVSGELWPGDGVVFWCYTTDETDGSVVLEFTPGATIQSVEGLAYMTPDGSVKKITAEGDMVWLDEPIPAGVEVHLFYVEQGGTQEIPFRYRLSLSGIELLPYAPNMKSSTASPDEERIIHFAEGDIPVQLQLSLFQWDERRSVFTLDADLFSDNLSIASAKLVDVSITDSSGTRLDEVSVDEKSPALSVKVDYVEESHDSVEMEISYPSVPGSIGDSVTVSGTLELAIGEDAARRVTVSVPCIVGTNFEVVGYSARIQTPSEGMSGMLSYIRKHTRVEGELQVVSIRFLNAPDNMDIEDVKVTTPDGKIALCKSFSLTTHDEEDGNTVFRQDGEYTVIFDGQVDYINVSVDSHQGAPVISLPFSFKTSVGGVEHTPAP